MADSNVFDLSYAIKATGSSTAIPLGSVPAGAPSSITIGGTAIMGARIVNNGNNHILTIEDDNGDEYSVEIPNFVSITGYSSCKFEQATAGGTTITSTGLNREISDITICYTGSRSGGTTPGGETNDPVEDPDDIDPDTTTPSTTTIRYFFKSTGDPADYNSGYTNVVNGTSISAVTISHYGMTLVAGQTYVKKLNYYKNVNGALITDNYDITSPVNGYLLCNIVSTPELSNSEEYFKTDYDIKVYCFKAPTITVAYTSTPDSLFGNPPATIHVQPNAYGSVGSFAADWGMLGGMVVTTTVSNIKIGYIFKWWNIKIGNTTTRDYGSGINKEYKYTVDKFDNVTITANFERLPAVTTQIDPSGAGTTTPTAGTITPTAANYQITLKATPNDGYVFKNWSKSGTNLSESVSYTYKASSGENVTIKANFEKIPDPGSEDIEIPTGYENKIATNKYIKDNILNVYSGYTGSEQNKCPTKSQIISRGGNAISIENSGDYIQNQCVKISDITYGGRNANVKVYLKGGSGSRSMETFEVYDGDNKIANVSSDSYGIGRWHTLFSNTKFIANNGSNYIFVRIGKFGVTSEVYSYFGTSDPSVTEDWLDDNAEYLGQLGNNATTKFNCKENWDTWIKGSNTMYIIIVLY
jgi:hypothetical protein